MFKSYEELKAEQEKDTKPNIYILTGQVGADFYKELLKNLISKNQIPNKKLTKK